MKAFNLTKQNYENIYTLGSLTAGETVYSELTKCVYYILHDKAILNLPLMDVGEVKKAKYPAKIIKIKFFGNSKTYQYWTCATDIAAGDKINITDIGGKIVEVTVLAILDPRMMLHTDIHATKILPLARDCKKEVVAPQKYYTVDVNYWDEQHKSFGEKLYTYQISQKNYEELDILLDDCKDGHSVNEYWDFIVMPNNKKVKVRFIKETFAQPEYPAYRKNIVAVRKNKNNDKENENMNMDKIFGNLKFGKVNPYVLRPSFMGIAFKAGDGFCTYNVENNELTNVAGFTMDNLPLYQMPVALDAVKVGDIIAMRDSGQYVVVKEILNDSFKCVIPASGVITEILPEKNIFNFNFVVKVFNPFENMVKPSADAPFGDMNSLMPLMLMSETSDGDDFFKMFAMMNMMQGSDTSFNPMMLMMMMNK